MIRQFVGNGDCGTGAGLGRVWGGPAAARRFAEAGVDLVLTGHIHAPFAWPYPFGDARTYGVGAGTLSLRERGVPPGFNLNRLTGDVIAVPTQAGTFSLSVVVEDTQNEAGRATATKTFSVTVN